ncbi:hypothetical protein [Streptomyces sp. NPDC056244]|uniref:hypothetical protein n=1 Tax=Streptomyces sp. NPDC056244 TaxID=3345762 RepID=UPI0035DA05D3
MPDTAGLYRLTNPQTDGPRRTRQAVHDLRRLGFHVQADLALDPALTEDRPLPVVGNGLSDRRSQIAQAAATRSPQRGPALTTKPPSTRLNPPNPAYAPASATRSGGHGRGRRA